MDCAEDVSRIGMTPAYEMGVTEATDSVLAGHLSPSECGCNRRAATGLHVLRPAWNTRLCSSFVPAADHMPTWPVDASRVSGTTLESQWNDVCDPYAPRRLPSLAV